MSLIKCPILINLRFFTPFHKWDSLIIYKIEVYPNPFQAQLNIKGLPRNDNYNFYLHDLLEHPVGAFLVEAESETATIPFLDLPDGMYFYAIRNSKNSIIESGKVLKGR